MDNTKIGKNNRFHQQLSKDVKCGKITDKEILKLKYKTVQLTDYFIKYNACNNKEYSNFVKKDKKNQFKLRIKAGFSSDSFSSKYFSSTLRFNNEDQLNGIGFNISSELEFVLAFNKNKWAIIFNPNYSSINVKETFKPILAVGFPQQNPYDLEIKYNKFNFPLGIRHYMFLSDTSKIYLNAMFSLFLSGNIKTEYTNTTQNPKYNFKQLSPSSFGVGYSFKDTYNIELKYESKSSDDFENTRPAYKTNVWSVIFAYKIF